MAQTETKVFTAHAPLPLAEFSAASP